jgi:hypothetical protein
MDSRTEMAIIIVSFVIITSFAGGGVGIFLLIILGFIGYSNSSKNSKKITEAKFHGSVFIQSAKATSIHNSCMARFEPPDERAISEFDKVFPAEMRATRKEDANLIIYMIWFVQPAG